MAPSVGPTLKNQKPEILKTYVGESCRDKFTNCHEKENSRVIFDTTKTRFLRKKNVTYRYHKIKIKKDNNNNNNNNTRHSVHLLILLYMSFPHPSQP
jgi:hypothetical protein